MYERRDYEAVADASQSKTIQGEKSQLISQAVKA